MDTIIRTTYFGANKLIYCASDLHCSCSPSYSHWWDESCSRCPCWPRKSILKCKWYLSNSRDGHLHCKFRGFRKRGGSQIRGSRKRGGSQIRGSCKRGGSQIGGSRYWVGPRAAMKMAVSWVTEMSLSFYNWLPGPTRMSWTTLIPSNGVWRTTRTI